MVFGLPFYRKQSQGTTIDKSAATQQYDLTKDLADLSLRERALAQKGEEKRGSDYHPTTVINRITQGVDIPDVPAGKPLKSADVSDSFQGFKLETTDALGGNVTQFIEKAKYYKGGGNVEPYFDVTLANGDNMKLNPNALSSRIVSAMGDINFRTGGERLLAPIKGKAVQTGKPTPKAATKPSPGDPLGLGIK
jgi:hypothetical protein